MTNPVLETIAQRRSIRTYTGEQITREQLDAILQSALCSPSTRNNQPWHFSVVQKKDLLVRMNKAAVKELLKTEDEAARARYGAPGYDIFHGAPTVIFLSADPAVRQSTLDCGIAVQTIALAAQSLGLGSVILGMPRSCFEGEEKEAFEKELDFPPSAVFQIAIAIGHPAAGKDKTAVGEGKITFIQ